MFGRARVGIAIAGGGCKAFFGLGAGAVLLEAGIHVTSLAGTSAGSAMAMSLAVGNEEAVVQYFRSITLRNPSNFHFRNLIKGKRPFPHERMFRHALATYADVTLLKKSKLDVAINALTVPRELTATPLKRAAVVAKILRASQKEASLLKKGRYRPVMVETALELGMTERVFRNADFTSNEAAAEIILASSSIPPMVKFQNIDGTYYLDGGIYNNLAASHINTNVKVIVGIYYELWTRLQLEHLDPKLAASRKIIYLSPDRALPVQTWDYANPRGVQLAYDAGRKAGEALLPVIKRMT